MPQTINVGARSLFVTAMAWLFTVLGALASASALARSATVAAVFPGLQLLGDAHVLPLPGGWSTGYLPWVLDGALVMSLAMLASAVGVLLRLDWARRVFIGVLAVAIVASLAGLWLQHEVVQSLVSSTLSHSAPIPPLALGVFGGFVTAARVMAVLVTLGACAGQAAIIRSLMSPAVRQEFA